MVPLQLSDDSMNENEPTTSSALPSEASSSAEGEQAISHEPSAVEQIWGKAGPPYQQFMIRLQGSITGTEEEEPQSEFEGISPEVVVRVSRRIKTLLDNQGGSLSGLFSGWPKTDETGAVIYILVVTYHVDPTKQTLAIEPGKAVLIGQWRGAREGVGCIVIRPEQRAKKAFPTFFGGAGEVKAREYQRLGVLLKLREGKLELSGVLGSRAFEQAKSYQQLKAEAAAKASSAAKEAGPGQEEAIPSSPNRAPEAPPAQPATAATVPDESPVSASAKRQKKSKSKSEAPSQDKSQDKSPEPPASESAPPKPVQFDGLLLSSGRGTSAFKVGMQMVVVSGEVKGGRTGARYRVKALKRGKGLQLERAQPL